MTASISLYALQLLGTWGQAQKLIDGHEPLRCTGTLKDWHELRQTVRLLRMKEDGCGRVVLYKLLFSRPTAHSHL